MEKSRTSQNSRLDPQTRFSRPRLFRHSHSQRYTFPLHIPSNALPVIEAKDIQHKGRDRTRDPYVVLRLHDQKHQTKYIRKTLNPVWNETFEL
jgi:hypothetical protein